MAEQVILKLIQETKIKYIAIFNMMGYNMNRKECFYV